MHHFTPRRAMRAAVAAVAVTVLAASMAACSGSTGGIKVTGAWARNSAAMAGAGAAYLVIQNTGSTADALVGASSPAAKTVETHETKVMDTPTPSMGMGGMGSAAPSSGMGGGSMMGMVPVSRIDIPAGGTVELKPGGYHLMLLELVADLKAGDTIEITLQFEKAGKITVKAEVRAQ